MGTAREGARGRGLRRQDQRPQVPKPAAEAPRQGVPEHPVPPRRRDSAVRRRREDARSPLHVRAHRLERDQTLPVLHGAKQRLREERRLGVQDTERGARRVQRSEKGRLQRREHHLHRAGRAGGGRDVRDIHGGRVGGADDAGAGVSGEAAG